MLHMGKASMWKRQWHASQKGMKKKVDFESSQISVDALKTVFMWLSYVFFSFLFLMRLFSLSPFLLLIG